MKKMHPLAVRNDASCIKRQYEEPQKDFPRKSMKDERSPFQRDRDRILYAKSFRRLMHKTQVSFTGEMNEHIRTRLTHTLEVAQIARSIARQLRLNEDLAEAIALGHDVGHTPFGHIGEYVLADILRGSDEKITSEFQIDTANIRIGFKHNYQSVRVLTEMESGYSPFNGRKGLNICYPVLEGILKHSKIRRKLDNTLIHYEGISDDDHFYLDQTFSASIEGQVVSLADEIAQVCHDVEDAIEADYDSKKLILECLSSKINAGLMPGIEKHSFMRCEPSGQWHIDKRYFKEFTSWIIHKIILDAVEIINRNMDDYLVKFKHPSLTNAEYYPIRRDLATENILIGHRIFEEMKEIQERFIINNLKINRENGKARYILRQIIKAYLTNPKQMPDKILQQYTRICSIKELKSELKKYDLKKENIRYLKQETFDKYIPQTINDEKFLRLLCDYVASMTDLYAFSEYRKLYLDANVGNK